MNSSTTKKVTWVLTVLVAPPIFYAGLLEALQVQFMTESFARWGYPRVLMILVGFIQLIGAVLLLIPAMTTFAAGALAMIMIGATVTLLSVGEAAWAAIPLIFLGVLLYVGWERSRTRTYWIETHPHPHPEGHP